MIKVIYRWQVEPDRFEEFKEVWRTTTNSIHETVAGAQGSFMIRSVDNQSEVLTIAKWDSLEDWKAFFSNNNPTEMNAMTSLGKRLSVEVYEEIEDHTK